LATAYHIEEVKNLAFVAPLQADDYHGTETETLLTRRF
jgi:hypothetical protein